MVDFKVDVTVILLTFNQEKYVCEALDSIVSQNFTKDWEIIVADDSSTDNTFKIVQSYKEKYPSLLKIYSNKKNLGLALNYQNAILKARGKYIAYLEGDDYWTDKFKLQKQFDYLEKDPSAILAFHDFILIDESGELISDSNLNNNNLKRSRTKKEMVTGCLIHQNTIMFRNVIRDLPRGFFRAKNHDTFLIAYLSNWGNAGFVECKPLHYRMLSNSLWSSLTKKQKHLNGLITFFWILTVVSPVYYYYVFSKIVSKVRSYIFCLIND